MVIGQDYGQKEEGSNLVLWKTGTYTNSTDVGLRTLSVRLFPLILMRCKNPVNAAPETLAEIMNYDYRIDLDGCEIGVFPVYHPGANSKRNRSMERQVEDWKRIKGYYDGVK